MCQCNGSPKSQNDTKSSYNKIVKIVKLRMDYKIVANTDNDREIPNNSQEQVQYIYTTHIPSSSLRSDNYLQYHIKNDPASQHYSILVFLQAQRVPASTQTRAYIGEGKIKRNRNTQLFIISLTCML